MPPFISVRRLLPLLASALLVPAAGASAATTYNVPADSPTINGAIALATAGDTVTVDAGSYNEDVVVNKDITLTGAGAGSSIISGPAGGGVSTVQVTASGATVEGFSITRDGNNTTDWNDPTLNSAGLAIQGQALTGITVRENDFYGNRTGIDVNNSNGHTITRNVINDNRTGLIFRNQTDNLTVTENDISNNWTVGVLFLDASGGTNIPVQTATNSSFTGNRIAGNWYGQVVDRQTGGALPAPGANVKDFSANYLGTTTPVVTTANSTEPGYAAQIPVAYGGSATAPGGQPDIAGTASANVDYTPMLGSGVDSAPATPGFQSAFTALTVTDDGAQNGSTGRVTEALNLAAANAVVGVDPGTYSETVSFGSSFTTDGIHLAGNTPADRPVITGGIAISNTTGNVIDGLTLESLIVHGVVADGRNGMISMQSGGGDVKDLTISDLLVDGEGLSGTNLAFQGGGKNAIYGKDLIGAVTIEDSVFQNLTGPSLFDTNWNGGTESGKYPTSITFSGNTVQNSTGGAAFRGQSLASQIPTVTVTDNVWDTMSGANSFGAAVKAFAVASFTATGNSFSDITASGFFPASEGGALDFAAGIDVKNTTTMDVRDNTFDNVKMAFAVDPGGHLPGGQLKGNTFTDNPYAIYIPANASNAAAPTIAGNRIVGSTVEQVHNGGTNSLNVENNWWGCNGGLNTAGCGSSSGTVDADPWLVASATAGLDEIQPGEQNALSVSLNKNSDDQTVANPIPATLVSFSSSGTATGTFSPTSASTSEGDTASTWTSDGSEGTATLSATIDNQTVSDTVDVSAAAPEGESVPVPENPVTPVEVTTGDETTVDETNPVAGSVEVPAGGNGGGVISISEIPSNTVPVPDQPSGFAVTGTTFEIHAPDQTTANPLKFTFVVNKSATSAIDDADVQVFRNGVLVADCTASLLDDPATPDPCVDSRTRLDPDTLQITVYSSQASFWVIGGTTPDAVIESGPGTNPPGDYYTNDNTPTFEYHGEDSANPGTKVDADFQCAIDSNNIGVDGVACGNSSGPAFVPASFTAAPALSDGVHTFYVQANDGFLSAGSITDQEFFVDTVAPDHTGFTAGPGFSNLPDHLTNNDSGTITWTRDDAAPSSGFGTSMCSLDGAAAIACDTGTSETLPLALAQGPHTLEVTLVDNAGNSDAGSIATYSWQIDKVAPDTTIDTTNPNVDPSNSPTASFTFSGDDNQAGQAPQPPSLPLTFQCRLDTPSGPGAWTACNAGNITYPGPLSDGLHTFRVRASDSAGNQDATEATYSWTVDRTLPVIHLRYPRNGGWYSKYKDVESDWDCTDTAPGIVVGTTSTVPEGQAIPRSIPGTNNFEITCTDNAGNVATSSTTYEIKEFHEIVNHNSPIAYYRLDDTDDVMADLSGHDNDGEYKNWQASEPFGISGDDNFARAFFGEGGYGYVNGLADPQHSHTLGAWVRFDTTDDAEILDHGYEAGLYLKDGHFVYRMMGASVTDPGPAVVAGQWYLVIGRWASGHIQLWTATGTPSIHTLPTMVAEGFQPRKPTAESTFYVGYGQDVPWLRGVMDEVFYYDSALSTDHINELWLADPPAEGKRAVTADTAAGDAAVPAKPVKPTQGSASSSNADSPKANSRAKAAKAKVKRLTKKLAAANKALAKLKRQVASRAKVRAAQAKVKRLKNRLRRARVQARRG